MTTKTLASCGSQLRSCCSAACPANIHDHQFVPAQPCPAADDSQNFVCTLLVWHLMQTQEHCVTGHSLTEQQLL